MMTLTDEKTVGEIAAGCPSSVRVFEKYQIDYCCGGKLSLAEACRDRAVTPAQLQAELERAAAGDAPQGRDWNAATLRELIDHIVSTHHEYMKFELPRLEQMIEKVLHAHGSNHADSLVPLGRTFAGLKEEIEHHLAKEEMILFPIIQNMEHARQAGTRAPHAHCGSVNNPIRVMLYEHDNAGQALAAMRQITGNYTLPAEACNTYRALFQGLQEMEADLHQHIHLENNILFPRAAAME
jgi:regulator of cell morphogenesis and NO signaling